MVNDVAVNVKLDLTRNRGQQVVYARANDTKVFNLHIVLTNNGRVVDLSQAVACIMYIKKPSGTEYANSMTRNGNELSYTIRTQDVDETGEVKAQVYVGLNDGTKFTSPVFTIQVYSDILSADINNLNIDSVNQYNAITDILAEAQKTVLEAKAHADSALEDVTEVEAIYEQVVVIKTDIEETAEDAIETIEAAITSAEASATAAAASATSATASETNAAASVVSAQSYAQQAETHKTSAETAVSTASGYAAAAADSATAAAASAENIDTYVTAAESWAIGGTESREGEDTNNAKYYAEKAETAAGSVEGALKPVGTITFAEIPADLSGKEGNMYNISDDFVSDSRFKDGSGKSYAAGTNIYVTYDLKLDCLVGKTYTLPTASSATLGGVKVGENMDIDADGYLTALSSAVILYSEAEYNAIPEADKAKNDYLVLDDSFDNGMKLYIKGNHVVIPKEYVLPIASSNTLGGIKIGENLSIDENGVVSAEAGGDTTVVLDTEAEYDALTEEEKLAGSYLIKESNVETIGASVIPYNSEMSIKTKIDALNNSFTKLGKSLWTGSQQITGSGSDDLVVSGLSKYRVIAIIAQGALPSVAYLIKTSTVASGYNVYVGNSNAFLATGFQTRAYDARISNDTIHSIKCRTSATSNDTVTPTITEIVGIV